MMLRQLYGQVSADMGGGETLILVMEEDAEDTDNAE